jgi:hypothetical protein
MEMEVRFVARDGSGQLKLVIVLLFDAKEGVVAQFMPIKLFEHQLQ